MKNLINEKENLTREKEFENFFNKHSKLIYSTVCKYCSDKSKRADAIQYVLTSVHTAYINKTYDFEDYKVIFTLAKNATLVFMRKKEVETVHLDDRVWDCIGETSNAMFRFSTLKTVLTEEQYELIYMVYVVRISLKEYSRMKNINYSNVKNKYYEILKILKHQLEGFLE